MAKNKRKIVVEHTTKFKNKDLSGKEIVLLSNKKSKEEYKCDNIMLILDNCVCKNTRFIGTRCGERSMVNSSGITANKCDFTGSSIIGGEGVNNLHLAYRKDCHFPSTTFHHATLYREDYYDGVKAPRNDFRKAVFHAESCIIGAFAGCVFSTGWGQRGMEKAVRNAIKKGNGIAVSGMNHKMEWDNNYSLQHTIHVHQGKLEL